VSLYTRRCSSVISSGVRIFTLAILSPFRSEKRSRIAESRRRSGVNYKRRKCSKVAASRGDPDGQGSRRSRLNGLSSGHFK
jgi:hypothetical protein